MRTRRATEDIDFRPKSSATPSGCTTASASAFETWRICSPSAASRFPNEAIRLWYLKFGPEYARGLKRRQGRLGDTWHLDEVFVTIQGERQYLWRAVDQDGDVIDILVQPRRDRKAAKRFFRKLLKGQCRVPGRLVTDKLRSYAAAHREVMPSVVHTTKQYANNRAEVSHEPTRQRERQMRRFKSPGQAQRFLTVHGLVQNLFRVGRHLLRAPHHRELRGRAFLVWHAATCA